MRKCVLCGSDSAQQVTLDIDTRRVIHRISYFRHSPSPITSYVCFFFLKQGKLCFRQFDKIRAVSRSVLYISITFSQSSKSSLKFKGNQINSLIIIVQPVKVPICVLDFMGSDKVSNIFTLLPRLYLPIRCT